jgi:uncharacterized protein (DUF433 family)/transposase-like protein
MITPKQSARILYGEFSPRDVPRYTLAQAARLVDVSPATLRSWVRGRDYPSGGATVRFEPLIRVDSDLLSFSDLVEVHILRSLRRDEDVRMSRLREAIARAREKFNIDRLLISEKLRAMPGEVLIDYYGTLINIGRAGQLSIRHALEAHLKRVYWDAQGPTQFFPGLISVLASPPEQEVPRLIVIDPAKSFGKPVLASRPGIRVSAIVSRIDAGETEDEVAKDYGIELREVNAAIDYERAA